MARGSASRAESTADVQGVGVLDMVLGGVLKVFARIGGAMAWRIRRFLSPREREVYDQHIEDLVGWRNATGLVLVVVAQLLWREDFSLSLDSMITSAINTPLVIAALVILSSLGMVASARSGHRRHMLARAWIPIRTVLGSALTLVLLVAIPYGVAQAPQALPARDPGLWTVVLPLVLLGTVVVFATAWCVVLTVGARAASQHYFRAVDAHPCLRAVVSIALSVWTLVLTGRSWRDGTGDFALPTWAVALLLVGGPLVNVALAAYELGRLRRMFGVDFRAVVGR